MNKLEDEMHHCNECDLYPCSLQEEVSKNDICKDCPTPCCRGVLVALLPCEEEKLENGSFGALKMNDDGWCYYFDIKNGICTIYEKRPITCRVTTCRFIIEGNIPDEIRAIKERIRNV
mgnify:CR=1 FL=1